METTEIENGFYISRYRNESLQNEKFEKEVSKEFIQFHFCQKGEVLLWDCTKRLRFSLELENYSFPR